MVSPATCTKGFLNRRYVWENGGYLLSLQRRLIMFPSVFYWWSRRNHVKVYLGSQNRSMETPGTCRRGSFCGITRSDVSIQVTSPPLPPPTAALGLYSQTHVLVSSSLLMEKVTEATEMGDKESVTRERTKRKKLFEWKKWTWKRLKWDMERKKHWDDCIDYH